MKKLLAILILAAGLFGGAASAHCDRQPNGSCKPRKASQFCKDHAKSGSEVKTDNVLVDSGSKTVAVCLPPGATSGSVAAHQRADGDGWVFVDGDDTNQGPTAGNLALQISQDTQKTGVAGACSGNYYHDDDKPLATPGISSPTTCAPAP